MANEKYTYLDSSGKEHTINLEKESFEYAQEEKTLHDVKFKSKPVTFARDALLRFSKNKSSIVATVILGFLILMSIILPFAIPYDVSGTHADETYLSPKLFKAGTGFWDGTKKYTDVVYDEETGYPTGSANLDNNSILMDTLKIYEGTTNSVYSFGKGGYIRIGNSSSSTTATATLPEISYNATMTLSFSVDVGLEPESYSDATYSIFAQYASGDETKTEILVAEAEEYGEVSYDLDLSTISDVENVNIGISVDQIESISKAVYVKDISLTSGSDVYTPKDINSALYSKEISLTGDDVSIYGATITYCSFKYDTYNAKYGDRTMTLGETQIKEYINKGYLSYDFNVGVSSFKIIDEKHCPIKEVLSQETSSGLVTVTNLSCVVTYYKYLGYTSMPLHLFGTNNQGRDILKYIAEGTRNSLGLAVIISLITFVFGLIFGAIEGYFGGVVDLLLERLVDILGYIPWIVVVTLCVLHLGQTFGVFILAMCLTDWISTSSITRTQFYRFKKREYVLASRSLGASDIRLIATHILPNSLGTIVTSSVLMIPSVIFAEASVSYLGIGLKGLSSLGVILSESQSYISTYPYILLFPSCVLALMMICFNLFGNGLRDALNPSLKGSD